MVRHTRPFVCGSVLLGLVFAMLSAAVSDLTTYKIRNNLVLALLLAYLVFAPVVGISSHEIIRSVAVAGVVLLVSFALFAAGLIGGGDAKLAAATALWFGFDHLLDYMIYASLLGGALTLLILQFRKLPLPTFLARQQWITRLHETGGGVPYGIALAAAALLIYPKTGWMPS